MPTTMQSPPVRRASAQQRNTAADQRALGRVRRPPDDDEYDDEWPPRLPTSAYRYPTSAPVVPRRGRALYLLVPVVFVLLGAVLAAYVPPAVQQWRDNSTYAARTAP